MDFSAININCVCVTSDAVGMVGCGERLGCTANAMPYTHTQPMYTFSARCGTHLQWQW